LSLSAVIKRLQHARTRRFLAILSLPVYLFLCLALFSALHVHSRNGTCNFNGIEFQGSEPAQAYAPVLDCGLLGWRESVSLCSRSNDGLPFHIASRGPPSIAPTL
jgi:hypothetical protein